MIKGIRNDQNHALPYIVTGASLVAVLATTVALLILTQNSIGMIGKDPGLIAILSLSSPLAVTALVVTALAVLRLRAPHPLNAEPNPIPEEINAEHAIDLSIIGESRAPATRRSSFDAELDTHALADFSPEESASLAEPTPVISETSSSSQAIAREEALQEAEILPEEEGMMPSAPIRITISKETFRCLTQEEFVGHMLYYETLVSQLSAKLLSLHPNTIFSDAQIRDRITQQKRAFDELRERLNDANFIAWLALDTLRISSTPGKSEYDPSEPAPTPHSLQISLKFMRILIEKFYSHYKPYFQAAFATAPSPSSLQEIAFYLPKDNEQFSSFLRALAEENIKTYIASIWFSTHSALFFKNMLNPTSRTVMSGFLFLNFSKIDKETCTSWDESPDKKRKQINHLYQTAITRLKKSPLGQCNEWFSQFLFPPVFYVHLIHNRSALHKAFQKTMKPYENSFKEMMKNHDFIYNFEYFSRCYFHEAHAQIRHFLQQDPDPESAQELAHFTVTETNS